MERILFNALFGAQSPDGRRIRYYTPLEGPRAYHQGDTYCCPNNYRRIVAELPRMILYSGQNQLFVNLFAACSVQTEIHSVPVSIQMDTRYPYAPDCVITVCPQKPKAFALNLRIPRWCRSAVFGVNDGPLEKIECPENGWFSIDRQWQSGDRIHVRLDMPLRLIRGRQAQAGRAAVMMGPLVFCVNRERHPGLSARDLHELVMDPGSLQGPFPDQTVVPGERVCRIKAWRAHTCYPLVPPDVDLTLTPFTDPGGEAVYLRVPSPESGTFEDDELLS